MPDLCLKYLWATGVDRPHCCRWDSRLPETILVALWSLESPYYGSINVPTFSQNISRLDDHRDPDSQGPLWWSRLC
jgi:hypothetical protein